MLKEFFKLNKPNFGLLFLRAVFGICFILHGIPKLRGGTEMWVKLGEAMSNFGITAYPAFWGFMASITEVLGGLLLLIGYKSRIASFFLAIVMAVAFSTNFSWDADFSDYALNIEFFAVFFALIFIGPGRFAIDQD